MPWKSSSAVKCRQLRSQDMAPWGRGSSPNNGRQSPWCIVISWPSTFNELRTRRPQKAWENRWKNGHKQHTSIFLEAPKDIHTCLSTLRLVRRLGKSSRFGHPTKKQPGGIGGDENERDLFLQQVFVDQITSYQQITCCLIPIPKANLMCRQCHLCPRGKSQQDSPVHLSFLSNIFIKMGACHVLSRLSFVTIRVVVEDQLDQGQFLAATGNHPRDPGKRTPKNSLSLFVSRIGTPKISCFVMVPFSDGHIWGILGYPLGVIHPTSSQNGNQQNPILWVFSHFFAIS